MRRKIDLDSLAGLALKYALRFTTGLGLGMGMTLLRPSWLRRASIKTGIRLKFTRRKLPVNQPKYR